MNIQFIQPHNIPKNFEIPSNTKTKFIAVHYEDDDTEMKYPIYVPVSPEMRCELYVHQERLSERDKKFVFAVLKNSDFTEGRGPMKLDKIFSSIVSAEEYVAKQEGVYGSSQYRQVTFGNSVKNLVYSIINHNGFEIKKMEVCP